MDPQKFGAFVQSCRKDLGLSQAELAEKLHVTAKAVSRWERGVGFPDIKLLQPLAEALEITIVELMQSKRIEKDLPRETAADLVSSTVDTLRQQEKLSRKRMVITFCGSLLIMACMMLLAVVSRKYRLEPEWVEFAVYEIAIIGGMLGVRALWHIPIPIQLCSGWRLWLLCAGCLAAAALLILAVWFLAETHNWLIFGFLVFLMLLMSGVSAFWTKFYQSQ